MSIKNISVKRLAATGTGLLLASFIALWQATPAFANITAGQCTLGSVTGTTVVKTGLQNPGGSIGWVDIGAEYNRSGSDSINTEVYHADPSAIHIIGVGAGAPSQITSAAGTGSFNATTGDYTWVWNSNRNNTSNSWDRWLEFQSQTYFSNLSITWSADSDFNSTGTVTPGNLISCLGHISASTITPPSPAAPSLTGTAGDTQATLSWSDTDTITTYTLKRGATTIYTGSGTTFTDTGLTNGTAYNYAVTGANANGSNTSSSLTLTPTAPAVPAYRLGGNSFGSNAILGTNDSFSLKFITGGVEAMHIATPTGSTPGGVSIGTQNDAPAGTALMISSGDQAITTQGTGLILRATDGVNCFRVTVDNAGSLSTTLATCPN